ncbi:MAG: MFS transporter [Actinomycetota bacterium]|nr:MFS transporter [Actinomycetota bacterium]
MSIKQPIGPKQFIALLSMVMALPAVGIDLMLPAFDDMRQAFGLAPDSNEVARIVTAYFLGMSLAPLPYGALADRIGRKPVLWLSGTVYMVGAIGSALAPSLGFMLIARFVWGLGAAGGRVVAFAIIRDTRQGEEMAKTMSYIMGVFVLVPIIAPSLGAIIIGLGPWRAVFWAAVFFAAVVLVWSRRLDETLTVSSRRPMSFATVGATAKRMVLTPATLASTLAGGALMASMASYLGSSQLMISEIFGRGAEFPIIFASVALLLGAASFLNGRLLGSLGLRRILPLASLVYVTAAGLTLMVSFIAGGVPNFWVFMPLVAVTLACQMILLPNLNTVALAPMADAAGTASALVATFTSAVGALIGAFIDAQMRASVTPFAAALTSAGLFVLVMVLWANRHLRLEGSGF